MTVAVALCAALAALSAFIPQVWICDLLSQFRLVLGWILFFCACVVGLMRVRIAFIGCLLAFLLNGIPIALMTIPLTNDSIGKTQSISILNFNTEFQHNSSYKLFEEVIASRRPDVVALVEVDQNWIDAIGVSTKPYPYSKIVIAGAGLALYSKFPIEKCEVRYFGKSHHPRILAVIKVGNQAINLIVAHPTTPKSELNYRERDQELSLIGDEIRALGAPSIFIGDLNCGPWAHAFDKLLRTGLRDSEQGFGPQPSWPARVGRVIEFIPVPPLVPIDHILVSDGIVVVDRQTGPAIHSDHLPVFAKLIMAK
jgi:endonuclease/exonuclease/phosphatase (EEP) superfamily protein YafD